MTEDPETVVRAFFAAFGIGWARDYFYDTTEFGRHYLPESHGGGAAKVLDGRVRAQD
jgi:hypothetical protein